MASDVCPSVPLGGVTWILHHRQSDFGWKEQTHRAIIALAVNDWTKSNQPEDIRQMELQLELEITKSLLKNCSSPIYTNDLALYIHALIATNRNPRNFYGIDLVANLLDIVGTNPNVHPFLVLALCNSGVVTEEHLNNILKHVVDDDETRQKIEYKALALKALACAKSITGDEGFNDAMFRAAEFLASKQKSDGSFGNVYTSSLVVQALISSGIVHRDWRKTSALAYLNSQSTVDVNMVSTYYIELARNAERVYFIKDLHPSIVKAPAAEELPDNRHFVRYTVQERPDIYLTITIKIPPGSNFFDVMKLSALHDSKFNFSHYVDKDGLPQIYSVAGVPNDAEENMFWRLCKQDLNSSGVLETIYVSPKLYFPTDDHHVMFRYRDDDCGSR